jgi:hypothetical protein
MCITDEASHLSCLPLLLAATCLLAVELLGMLKDYTKDVPFLAALIKPLVGFLDRVSTAQVVCLQAAQGGCM